MPIVLRPRQQNTSDPLYTGAGVPVPFGFARVPLFLRVLWMLVLASFVLAYMPGQTGSFNGTLRWLLLAAGLAAAMPYAYRAVRHGLLWRLRNKLILTYLLIGFTPVVLVFHAGVSVRVRGGRAVCHSPGCFASAVAARQHGDQRRGTGVCPGAATGRGR